jgi:hypothetical protein
MEKNMFSGNFMKRGKNKIPKKGKRRLQQSLEEDLITKKPEG